MNKLSEELEEKYEEFVKIFEEEIKTSHLTRAHNTKINDEKLQPNDFVMVRYPSRLGHFKYGIVKSIVEGSSHRYNIKMIGKRNKKGTGKIVCQIVDIKNLVLLHRPIDSDIVKKMDNSSVNVDALWLLGEPIPSHYYGLDKTSTDGEAKTKMKQPARQRQDLKRKERRRAKMGGTDKRRKERRAAFKGGIRPTVNKILSRTPSLFCEQAVETADLASLSPGELVTDGVLDTWGALLQKDHPEIVIIPTLLIQKMLYSTDMAVDYFMKSGVNLFKSRRLIFPWNFPARKKIINGKLTEIMGHWITIVVDLEDKKISIYDSVSGDNYNKGEAVSKIKEFLFKLHLQHCITTDLSSWKTVEKDCPKQASDSLDCGVFTAFSMKAAAAFTEPTLSDNEATAARLELAARVHRGI